MSQEQDHFERVMLVEQEARRSGAFGQSWFVSPHNFAPDDAEAPPAMTVHDTTLRDGEQQSGVSFTPRQKVEIAAALDHAGVDRIEAGMVAVSEQDRVAIRDIVQSDHKAEIWTIARSTAADAQMAIDCGVDGTGVIILANAQYCEIFHWTVGRAIEMAVSAGSIARGGGLSTTLLLADAGRLSKDDLAQIVGGASSSGSFDAIALMDTFGVLSPVGVHRLVGAVREHTDLPLEFHGHNDFGLAVANSIAAVLAGASVIHTAVNGLGERVGNTALEEIVMASKLLYHIDSGVDTTQLAPISEMVRSASGVEMAPTKPVVGPGITHIESGTVAAEYRRWRDAHPDRMQWLFPYEQSMVGGRDVTLTLGKGAGMANVEAALDDLGIITGPGERAAILGAMKAESSRLSRGITREEFRAIAVGIASEVGT